MSCLQLALTVRAGRVTIDILHDDVLLLIFYFDGPGGGSQVQYPSWHRLVHVCRRWRSLVFASPNFLDLRLVCGPKTRVELIGVWPPLPIVIRDANILTKPEDYGFDIAMHRARVREINLDSLTNWQLEQLDSTMQEPFPALTRLRLNLHLNSYPAPALSDGFLIGSAPHLRSLELYSIEFPALPKLLLSATNLVTLINFYNITDSGYISPETLVTLANLELLIIQIPISHPDRERRHPRPPTRTALSALTRFDFQGPSEYLEDFVAMIDAPLLDSIHISCMPISEESIFNLSQLGRFMGRTTAFQELNEVHVFFNCDEVEVNALPPAPTYWGQTVSNRAKFKIEREFSNLELRSVARILAGFFPSICTVEHLHVSYPYYLMTDWISAVESVQRLEIFRPFTAVKNLYLCHELAQCVAPALQELVGDPESVANVLPALESIFLEDLEPSGPVQEAIGQFVAARQALGHPVAVSNWNWIGHKRCYTLDIYGHQRPLGIST